MLSEIETTLNQLRLHGMQHSWQSLVETRRHFDLTLTEGIELLLQAERDYRGNRRTDRYRKNARFRYQASLSEITTDAARGLDRQVLAQLATGDYIVKGESVLITGATGSGKSYLASALGNQACSQGYKVAYYNLQKLLLRNKMSRADGSIGKFFDKTAKTNLLILDDFGLTRLEQQHSLDLMEMIEDRHGKHATIIASQIPVASWYDLFAEETLADAILDRLVHSSYRIELKGESLRKKR